MTEPWMTDEVQAKFAHVQEVLSRTLAMMGFRGWETNADDDDLYINIFDGYSSGQIEMTKNKEKPFNACILNEIAPTFDNPPDVEIVWEEDYSSPYDCIAKLLGQMLVNTIEGTVQEVYFDDTLPEYVEVT